MREAVVSIGDADLAALGLDDLVSLCRDAGLLDFEEFACLGTGAVVQVEVETRLDEGRLDALDCVDEWDHVSAKDDAHLYLVAFTAPAISEDAADHAGDLVGTCDPDIDERGATLSFTGSQDAIRGTLGEDESAGASPDLRKLGAYDGRNRPLDALTDRQREVVRTAYDMGYYEVPREVSTGDVAAELDLDPSTVAEHLQRAERNLLRHHLSPSG
jgi:DNA-binding CsgD family transcriptional regulator